MAKVFLAFDEEIGAEVALKTLNPLEPGRLLSIKREFRELADVVHPNLVELYELVVTDDESFFTMEFVDGANFVEHVRADALRLGEAASQLV